MDIAISVGEISGDRNAAALIRELKNRIQAGYWGIGGREMRAAGADIIYDMSEMGTIGVFQTLKYLPRFLYRYYSFRRMITRKKPDLLVLVDFGFFNTRLAMSAAKQGIRCLYYFPPSSWRRRPSRPSALIRADCSVITPFPWSAEILAGYGLRVRYPGHPLVDLVRPDLSREEYGSRYHTEGESIGFLAGSRNFEIDCHLPVFFEAVRLLRARRPDICCVFAATPEKADYIRGRLVREFGDYEAAGVRLAVGDTYNVMAHSALLCSCSGTATLEAGILGTPMLIVYRGTAVMRLEYSLRKSRLGLPGGHIGMPNIVLDRSVCRELLACEVTGSAICEEAMRLLESPEAMAEMRASLGEIREILGPEGVTVRAAECFAELIKDTEK
ncbi:MAG: hypothetical protein IK083_08680 [Abditibacteriota bacterium]|nr:hypothetical protein [Abditibacteriota bacterium]